MCGRQCGEDNVRRVFPCSGCELQRVGEDGRVHSMKIELTPRHKRYIDDRSRAARTVRRMRSCGKDCAYWRPGTSAHGASGGFKPRWRRALLGRPRLGRRKTRIASDNFFYAGRCDWGGCCMVLKTWEP